MTPEDISLLWQIKGGHELARLAVNPDLTTRGFRESCHEIHREAFTMRTHRDGLHINPGPDVVTETTRTPGKSGHVITWKAMTAHARAHTTPEVAFLIRAFDQEWCEVKSMPDVKPGQWRYSTPEEDARIAQCERWLEALAREVWDPALATPAAPQIEQLDMLTYLEEMTP